MQATGGIPSVGGKEWGVAAMCVGGPRNAAVQGLVKQMTHEGRALLAVDESDDGELLTLLQV